MIWIRSARYDCCWFLSGIPIATILYLFVHYQPWLNGLTTANYTLFAIFALFQTSHNLSPTILSWAHPELRRTLILRRPILFVGLPLVMLALACGAAWCAVRMVQYTNYDEYLQEYGWGPKLTTNPLVWAMVVYLLWNAYHFASQIYGVLSLYRTRAGFYRADQRRHDRFFGFLTIGIATYMLFGTGIGMLVHFHIPFGVMHLAMLAATVNMLWREWKAGLCIPRLVLILTNYITIVALPMRPWGFLLSLTCIALAHWLTAIGLSAHVYGNRLRISAILPAVALIATGVIVYELLFLHLGAGLRPEAVIYGPVRAVVWIVAIRYWLGWVHFLYDAVPWRLSRPTTRAALGPDLFGDANKCGL